MKNKFYDFFKVDDSYPYAHGDFSAANGECLTEDERIEFLKNYSAFLDKKNGTENGSRKAADEETVEKATKAVSYKLPHKVRKRIEFDEMNARVYDKPEDYEGWQFYQSVRLKNGELLFSDGVIPPVPCAKYEFSAENFSSIAFSFTLPKDYIDEEKFAEKISPLTTDTGRIIELRRGVKEIVKLQIYRNGEIYARVGLPDPYHHRNFKIGDYKIGEPNDVKIDFDGDFYNVAFNGEFAGKFELTGKLCPDTLFVSGGMHPVCDWTFCLKELTANGKTTTEFFKKAGDPERTETDLGEVKLPFKIGGEKNKDKIIEFTKKFGYSGGKALLNVGSADPVGEVFVNGRFAFKTDGFLMAERDITEFLQKGENELKIFVLPRAPEINYSWHKNNDPYLAWFLRGVYIDVFSGVRIKDFIVKTLSVTEKIKAEISFETEGLKEGAEIKIYLAPSFGNNEKVGKEEIIYSGAATERFKKTLGFDAECWSCENPALYAVRAEISCGGKPVDDEIIETGFRTIEQKNGEILLNGKRIMLNGALWMQFLPPYENIVLSHVCPETREIVLQAEMTGAMNGNVARFHMLGYGTNDSRFASVCDRLGLMNIWTTRLIDSAETISVEKGWQSAGAYATQMKEVINHPSIIMWEGSNEFHSSRAVLDKMFDEFVTTVKSVDDTRIICPCSHLYYGGGLYGNKGFYYQDDGEKNQDFEPCESSFGWKDEKVIRSSHNYEILLGYGNRWDLFREQGWKSQNALFNSKKHAYIISEFAVVGRHDDTTPECKDYVKNDSYELADEKRAFGGAYDKLDFKLSQAYQALCAYNTVKYMRYLGADGLMWCCLTGGANDASYIKPPIDFYGYKKQAFYSLKEGFAKTICFDKKTDVVYGKNILLEPAVTGAEEGKTYRIIISVKNLCGKEVSNREILCEAAAYTFEIEPVPLELENGYYSVEYTVEEVNKND